MKAILQRSVSADPTTRMQTQPPGCCSGDLHGLGIMAGHARRQNMPRDRNEYVIRGTKWKRWHVDQE